MTVFEAVDFHSFEMLNTRSQLFPSQELEPPRTWSKHNNNVVFCNSNYYSLNQKHFKNLLGEAILFINLLLPAQPPDTSWGSRAMQRQLKIGMPTKLSIVLMKDLVRNQRKHEARGQQEART